MSELQEEDTRRITLGEVNRNVIRVEKAMQDSAKHYATRMEMDALTGRVKRLEDTSATRDDIKDVRDLIQDIKDGLKSKGAVYLQLAAILVPTAVAIWSVIHK